MKKIFLFNGPPGSGKDTAANIIEDLLDDVYLYKMAYPLKESCHKLLGLTGSLEELEYLKEHVLEFSLPRDFVEHNKTLQKPLKIEVATHEQCQITLRQLYIHISENLMKPLFGPEIFGKLAVKYITQNDSKYVAISDCGFKSELEPLLKTFDLEDFILIKLYRNGKSYVNDSRNYINIPEIQTIELNNNGSILDLKTTLQDIIRDTEVELNLTREDAV